MLDIYLRMGHNNWAPWGDKDTISIFLVENSNTQRFWTRPTAGFGQLFPACMEKIQSSEHPGVFWHINQLCYIFPSFYNFVSVHAWKMLSWKGSVTRWWSSTYAPAGTHTPSSMSEQPGLIGTFGTCLLEGAPYKTIIALHFLCTTATEGRHA